MDWYYSQNDQVVGPFDENTIQRLLTAGVISRETLVYNSQLSAWAPLADFTPASAAPQPPQNPTAGIRIPRDTENPDERRFPRKPLYADACMVMIFVMPSLTRRHSILICFLMLAFALAGVELCHLARRDVTRGLAGARYKRSVTAILVCAYVLLALSLIPFLVILINSFT